MEKNYIYNLVPGTEGFSFQVADKIASDRETYLSQQLSALKVVSLIIFLFENRE